MRANPSPPEDWMAALQRLRAKEQPHLPDAMCGSPDVRGAHSNRAQSCHVSAHSNRAQSCHVDPDKWQRRLDALRASGLVADENLSPETVRLLRSRSGAERAIDRQRLIFE